jgi:hypothetical protein
MANNSIILCLSNPNILLDNYNNKSDNEDYYEDYTNTTKNSVIKQYDPTLKKLKKICLNYVVNYLNSYDNQIICFSRSYTDNLVIHIYDEKLANSMNIECKINQPFYIPFHIDKVQICGAYYVFLDTISFSREIILLDRTNGWIKKRFNIESYDFLLDSATNRILTYSISLNQVVSYDFEGKSQKFDLGIPKTNSNSIKLVDCLNDKFVFWDSKSNCLYF